MSVSLASTVTSQWLPAMMQLALSLFWDHRRFPTSTQVLALYISAKTIFKANTGEKCGINQNILKAETVTKIWNRLRSTHLGRSQ